MSIRQKGIVFFSKGKSKTCSEGRIQILERERVTSLKISWRSNRQFSTEQEAKSIYAMRATRGHRFCGVLKTPRGSCLLLLVLFFG